MPASPSRIGFVMEPVRRAVSETAAVTERHGSLARRDDEPVETFFDSVADAHTMADARQALLSPERRRFSVTVAGLDAALELDIAGPELPVGSWNDPDKSLARDVAVSGVGFDFGAQKAALVVWG